MLVDLGEMRPKIVRIRTGEEAVKLHEELKVDIVALRRLAVRRLDVMAVEIDTYCAKDKSAIKKFRHAQIRHPVSCETDSMVADINREALSTRIRRLNVVRIDFTYPFWRLC